MRRMLRAFRRRNDGSVAIEAAFIVPLFFMLVFSIFEAGWVFHRTAMVEQAVAEMGRTVKVGLAYTATDPSENRACDYGETDADGNPCPCETGKECNFDDLCKKLRPYLAGRCIDQLSVEVRRFASFEDVATASDNLQCPSDPGYSFAAQAYEPGSPNDIVRVRACFVTKTINPVLGALELATSPNGDLNLRTGQIFRREIDDNGFIGTGAD